MATLPSVRVVIPAFNAARYLVSTIDSIMRVSGVSVEVVIVNDGSSDLTLSVAQGIAEAFTNVRVVDQPNLGVSAARNAGLEGAAQYVCFLDADDQLTGSGLSMLVQALELNSEAVAAYGRLNYIIDDEVVISRETHRQSGVLKTVLLEQNLIDTPGAVLFRASQVLKVGGFQSAIKIGEDWNLYVRLAQLGEIIFVPSTVVNYRIHAHSVMGKGQLKLSDFFPALNITYSDPMVRQSFSSSRIGVARLRRESGIAVYLVRRARSGAEMIGIVRSLLSGPRQRMLQLATVMNFWRLMVRVLVQYSRIVVSR